MQHQCFEFSGNRDNFVLLAVRGVTLRAGCPDLIAVVIAVVIAFVIAVLNGR